MSDRGDTPTSTDTDGAIDEMFQHLKGAKERYQTNPRRPKRKPSSSSLQQAMQERSDVAVLASNHEVRLNEIVEHDAVTHRSNKRWVSAKAGVDAHGRLPIYYRLDGLVTHTGYISRIVIDPDGSSAVVDEFMKYVTDADDYNDYYDGDNATMYIVTARYPGDH